VTRIVIKTPLGRAHLLDALRDVADVEVTVVDSEGALVEAMANHEVVVMTGSVEAYTPRVALAAHESRALRWIHLLSMGHEAFSLHGWPSHVQVTGPGDVVSACVAEHAVALVWALARQLPVALMQQRAQVLSRALSPSMRMLSGRTAVVVGLGRVGLRVARLLSAIGMQVDGVSRSGNAPVAGGEVLRRVASEEGMRDLLAQADVVVLALPGTAATQAMFGAGAFAACRPGVLLCNVGRGSAIDHDALVEALLSGVVAGAALDVTAPEPLPPEHPLWALPNVVITPHVGGAGDPTTFSRMAAGFVGNLTRYRAAAPLTERLNRSEGD